jgi:hypothetical protein
MSICVPYHTSLAYRLIVRKGRSRSKGKRRGILHPREDTSRLERNAPPTIPLQGTHSERPQITQIGAQFMA